MGEVHPWCPILERAEARMIASSVQEWGESHPGAEATVERCAGGYLVFAGRGCFLSRAVGVGIGEPVTATDVERVLEFFASRGDVPRVDLSPASDPALGRWLVERGLVVGERKNVLALDMARAGVMPAREQASHDADVTLHWIDERDGAGVEPFLGLVRRGFDVPDEGSMGPYRLLAAHSIGRRVIATRGGAGAGSGIVALIPGEGGDPQTANLTCGSVLAPFRRKGIQAAMMVERLRRARAEGHSLAFVRSRPGVATERNAERLGFGLVYEKVMVTAPV